MTKSAMIETKNATIDTMTVTIQALHVSDKQMTLAVFRQLPVENAYNGGTGCLNPFTWWGIVRYSIKGEGNVWAVGSKDGILYRLNASPPISAYEDLRSLDRIEKQLGQSCYQHAWASIRKDKGLSEKRCESGHF